MWKEVLNFDLEQHKASIHNRKTLYFVFFQNYLNKKDHTSGGLD